MVSGALRKVLLLALALARNCRALEVWCVAHPLSPLESVLRLATELGRRGHRVRVGSTDKARRKVEARGLPFLDLGTHHLSSAAELALMEKASNSSGVLTTLRIVREIFDGTDSVLQAGLAQQAQLLAAQLPDILVCSAPSASCARFAVLHGLPFVWTVPTFGLLSPAFSQLPYVPNIFMDLPYGRMTPWQRLCNLLSIAAFKFLFPLVGWPLHTFRDTIKNLPGRLVLVPGVPGLDYPQHTAPLVQYTGPYLTPQDADPNLLSPDVRAWLDSPRALPVLYISMGTVVQLSQQLCGTILEAVRGGAAAGEFRALWALPANQHSCLGAGGAQDLRGPDGPLMVASWIPTPAALAHPTVKAFLSHCGANGATEAVWAQVPILGMPFFGDQPANSRRVRDLGLGLLLDRSSVTEQDIRHSVRRLLDEGHFESAARRVGHVMRAFGGVARAADLVEMVHSLGGDLEFLQTPVEREGVIVAYCLDLLLAAVVFLSLCSFCCGRQTAAWPKRLKGRQKAE